MLFISLTGFTNKKIALTGFMNARATANFSQDKSNVLFVLDPGTEAKIESFKKMPSGNYGFNVKITSGPHKDKKVWVYFNVANPTLKIDALPEVARTAAAIAETPATRTAPEEVLVATTQMEGSSHCSREDCDATPEAPRTGFIERLTDFSTQSPIVGAYRVMASLYQSCSVLTQDFYNYNIDNKTKAYIQNPQGPHRQARLRTIPAGNLDAVIKNHFYLSKIPSNQDPQCMDMTKTPPVYHYGGKAEVKNNVIDLFGIRKTGGVPVTGIDCSGFVSIALTTSGLKLTPNVRSAAGNSTGSYGLMSYNSGNSCFTNPDFSEKTIQPGDIIARGGHTYTIDAVGDDPFGFKKMKLENRFPSAAAGCHRLESRMEDLDFSVIQSGSAGDMSAMRSKAKNYIGGRADYRNITRIACLAEFGIKVNAKNYGTRVLRHKGSTDPRCVFSEDQRPTLKGEECTKGCTQEIAEVLQ